MADKNLILKTTTGTLRRNKTKMDCCPRELFITVVLLNIMLRLLLILCQKPSCQKSLILSFSDNNSCIATQKYHFGRCSPTKSDKLSWYCCNEFPFTRYHRVLTAPIIRRSIDMAAVNHFCRCLSNLTLMWHAGKLKGFCKVQFRNNIAWEGSGHISQLRNRDAQSQRNWDDR